MLLHINYGNCILFFVIFKLIVPMILGCLNSLSTMNNTIEHKIKNKNLLVSTHMQCHANEIL